MRCSGGSPCTACSTSGNNCLYSTSNRKGRPKGTKNKKTNDKLDENRVASVGNSTPHDSSEIVPGDKEAENEELSNVSTNMEPEIASTDILANGNFSHFPSMFDDFDASTWGSTTYDFLGNNFFVGPQEDLNTGRISASMNSSSRELQLVHLERAARSFPSSTASSTTVTNSAANTNTCSCLNDHAELLCRLKELDQKNSLPTLDVILVGVQHCLNPWKALIKCRVCRRNEDQEVMLLSALTLRLVLRRLLDFCASQRSEDKNTTMINTDQMVDAPGSETRCTVGMYELQGDEKALMMDTLLWYTLRRVKCAIITLQERLCYLRANASKGPGELADGLRARGMDYDSDVGHIQQMVCGFEEKLRILEEIFQGTGSARWQMISWDNGPLVSQ